MAYPVMIYGVVTEPYKDNKDELFHLITNMNPLSNLIFKEG
ncbi:hypothetical protein [Aquibacillus albus]|nr:hypothetical protein [Aquibacillus albus]